MPAISANANNFLLNTDYPLDKIIYKNIGYLPSVTSSTLTIAHGLSFIPLIYLQWSLTSDFAVCYEITSQLGDTYSLVFPYVISISANATNIVIDAFKDIYSGYAGGAADMYFRIVGFMPSNSSDNEALHTSGELDIYSLNTDYNYTKLFMSDTITVSSAPTSITHGLGYVPQVIIWEEYSSPTRIEPLFTTDISDDPLSGYHGSNITTTQLVFNRTGKYHYRIYLDE